MKYIKLSSGFLPLQESILDIDRQFFNSVSITMKVTSILTGLHWAGVFINQQIGGKINGLTSK